MMKATAKIPNGFRRLRMREAVFDGDFCLATYSDSLRPGLVWERWEKRKIDPIVLHYVRKGEVFIRRRR
jgi:hypothetical protein